MKQGSLHLLQNLIKIDSQNPPGNERRIILFIRDYLKKLGLASRILEFKKDRLNLMCCLRSRKPRKTLLFTPHVDTVPAGNDGWKFPPFSAFLYKGKLYGRGATDCKINVAAALLLIERLKKSKITLNNLDLVFAFCADEETGSHYGTIPLAAKLKGIDYGVVLDADDFNIIVAQKGLLHVRVELTGVEAHGAYPERGTNAVVAGVRILNEILDTPLPFKKHALLIKPTLNIGRFCGGDKVNVVAGYAFFELDIRYLPSMDKDKIISMLTRIIRAQGIPFRIKVLAHQKPIEIDPDLPSIKCLRSVLKARKIPFQLKPSFGATVINFLEDRGIKSFAFGFGSAGNAHSKNEHVKLSNLDNAVDVLTDYVVKLDSFFS